MKRININKIISVFMALATTLVLIGCPESSKEDNSALAALVALNAGSGSSCTLDVAGTQLPAGLTVANNSAYQTVNFKASLGGASYAIVILNNLTASNTVVFDSSLSGDPIDTVSRTVYTDSSCPIDSTTGTVSMLNLTGNGTTTQVYSVVLGGSYAIVFMVPTGSEPDMRVVIN